MGESLEAKVRSGYKRTLSSYHKAHKSTGVEPLGSQTGSGQKPTVSTRVPARDVSENHLEGGWIGNNANQCTNKNYDVTISQNKTEAGFPVKGSELLPRDSSGYELEVHNAILLYGTLIDKMNENKWILQ